MDNYHEMHESSIFVEHTKNRISDRRPIMHLSCKIFVTKSWSTFCEPGLYNQWEGDYGIKTGILTRKSQDDSRRLKSEIKM